MLVEGNFISDVHVDLVDVLLAGLVNLFSIGWHATLDEGLLEDGLSHLLVVFSQLQELDAAN